MAIRLICQTQLSYHLKINSELDDLLSREPSLLHIMLKQGMTWFSLEHSNKYEEVLPEIAQIIMIKINTKLN